MAEKAIGNGRGTFKDVFQNETHWSKLKQPTLALVCYTYVK
jgi:hypothetical protein